MAGVPIHDVATLALVILLREVDGFRRDYGRAHNLDSN